MLRIVLYSQEMSVGAAGVCVWWPKDDAGVNRLMDVTVPAGSGAGDTVEFADAEGNTLTAVVPDGLSEGDVFRVDELGMPVESTGSIMERFASWFEREEIGDQIDKFIRDNAGVLGTHRPRIDMNAEHSHDLWPLFQEYSARFDAANISGGGILHGRGFWKQPKRRKECRKFTCSFSWLTQSTRCSSSCRTKQCAKLLEKTKQKQNDHMYRMILGDRLAPRVPARTGPAGQGDAPA